MVCEYVYIRGRGAEQLAVGQQRLCRFGGDPDGPALKKPHGRVLAVGAVENGVQIPEIHLPDDLFGMAVMTGPVPLRLNPRCPQPVVHVPGD